MKLDSHEFFPGSLNLALRTVNRAIFDFLPGRAGGKCMGQVLNATPPANRFAGEKNQSQTH